MAHWFDALATTLAGISAPPFSIGTGLAPMLGTQSAARFAAGGTVTVAAQPVIDAPLTGPLTVSENGSAATIRTSTQDVFNNQAVAYEKVVTKDGAGAGRSSSRSTITIAGKTILQVMATRNSSGKTPFVEVNVKFTSAQANGEVSFYSNDGLFLQGTINGRKVRPFPIRSDASSVRYSDGSTPSSAAVEPNVEAAIAFILTKAKEQQTAANYSVSDPLAYDTEGRGTPVKEKAGHGSNPAGSSNCIGCEAGCAAAGVGCAIGVAGGCSGALIFYLVCLGIGEGSCAIAEVVCVGLCHNVGAPCCPVGCGDGCCASKEICLDPNRGVCCSQGAKTCSNLGCCDPTDTCIPSNGGCCPKGQQVCKDQCCAPGQVCQNGSVCCPANQKVCGNICCPPNSTCVDGKCCPEQLACGNVCCDELSTCADAKTGTCCSFASVVCGTVCCPPGASCINGTCCPGNSVCGGICCPSGETCLDAASHKCAPCPAGTVACSPDPEGPGLCCPTGHSCCNGACCPNASDICCTPVDHAGSFGCNPVSYCIE